MPQDSAGILSERAKRYSRIKYSLSIFDTAYLVALLFIFVGSGLSQSLSAQLSRLTANDYLVAALYLLVITLAYQLLKLPFDFYASYMVMSNKLCKFF